MDAQLFIRTWEADLDWLRVCLKSAAKYWRSDLVPVIVATPQCFTPHPTSPIFKIGPAERLHASVHIEEKSSDQRRGANYIGMHADTYCVKSVEEDDKMILITDSDCLFTRECGADHMVTAFNPKILIYGQDYESLLSTANPQDHNCFTWYKRVVNEVLGIDPPAEYMRRHPFMFHASTIRNCRNFIRAKHRKPLILVMQQYHSGYFSEFNLISAYALRYEPDRYDYCPIDNAGPPFIRQFHSWSQTPQGCADEIRKILGE